MISRALPALCCAIAALASPAAAEEYRSGGKLLLTGGVTSVEGAAGGGLATWSVIAGDETEAGIGARADATAVLLPDFSLKAAGAAIGLHDRIELSYQHQSFDTRAAGAALGLGHGFTFGQDIVGAKVRVAGDLVYDQDTWLPVIAVGVQYHFAQRGAVLHAVGAEQTRGADVYASATKLFLAKSLLADVTVRATKANQFGLLGFGGDGGRGYRPQVEGSLGLMLSRRFVVGAEGRTKPDNLRFATEKDAWDVFAAWQPARHLTLTAAYADLGPIATFKGQHGAFLQIQGSL